MQRRDDSGEGPVPGERPWRGGAALRDARTCYDHLAGRLGVALADALTASGHVRLGPGACELTPAGATFLAARGVVARPGRRPLCRGCLDWSERRPHIAGTLGAALAAHAFAKGWVRRLPDTRAISVTPAGIAAFTHEFGLRFDA